MEQLAKARKSAQTLRKNMTKEERHLWYDFLKTYPVQFKRQYSIGTYIVDFCCYQAMLVIELDGSQHFEVEGKRTDAQRDAYLQALGLTVLRYANSDVNLNFNGVCEDIWNRLKCSEKKPSP